MSTKTDFTSITTGITDTTKSAKDTLKDMWNKVKNWWTKSFVPACTNFWNNSVEPAINHLIRNTSINWMMILALVVLWLMSKNGMLDDLPNVRWVIQVTGNLIDWLFGLLHSLVTWVTGYDTLLPDEFEAWFREIMCI